MKLWGSLFAFLTFVSTLHADNISIQIKNRKDYEALERFFKIGIYEEEYGYVLEGIKPVSLRFYHRLDQFPTSKDLKHSEQEFAQSFLVQEGIPVWNELCSKQRNFILKTVSLKDINGKDFGVQVQFTNFSKLKEVIDNNIDLFRYALGPSINSKQLVERIAFSDDRLESILKNDPVLIGIILGFGSHNSLIGGHIDKIGNLTISKDYAPLLPKSVLMQSKKNHSLSFITPERYGTYYLEYAGGDDQYFRSAPSFELKSEFLNAEDELLVLDSMEEPIPPTLHERPQFTFAAYKEGPSNQPFFESLKKTQSKIQALLKKQNFLAEVLKKIGGKEPLITCDKSPCSDRPIFNIDAKKWSSILQSALVHFEDKEEQKAFTKAIEFPSSSFEAPPMMKGASKAMLKGLKKAIHNLEKANIRFEALSKDNTLQSVAKKQLYFKTLVSTSGKELKNQDFVRVGYVIEDPKGNVLFANHDTWLNLSRTIPGFYHGIQGMHVGEKRTSFYPSYSCLRRSYDTSAMYKSYY